MLRNGQNEALEALICCHRMNHRRKKILTTINFVMLVFVSLLGLFPLTCWCTIVEAPTYLLSEEQKQPNNADDDLAAFVSPDHLSNTKNIHHHNSQQTHDSAITTQEDHTAFVSDHGKIVPHPEQQPAEDHYHHHPTPLSQTQQQQQRRWGTTTGKSKLVAPQNAYPIDEVNSTAKNESVVVPDKRTSGSNGSTASLPFIPPKLTSTVPTTTAPDSVLHPPPEGFVVTARVYTDPADKLSHFDNVPTNIILPFYECGAMGLSTNALPLSHASFRHALAGSQVWSGDFFIKHHEDNTSDETLGDESSQQQQQQQRHRRNKQRKTLAWTSKSSSSQTEEDDESAWHPQLVIALTDLEIVLNSGESKLFRGGDVILLEDTVLGGHKLRAVMNSKTTNTGSGGATTTTTPTNHLPQDMTVLILTLPHYYHQLGKDHHSLQGFTTTLTAPPCPVDDDVHDDNEDGTATADTTNYKSLTMERSTSTDTSKSWVSFASRRFLQFGTSKKQVQQLALGVVGLSISTVLADFLGKVAPLWLAVGVGGTCFVAGGTYCIVTTGMQAIEYLDMTWERQRLLATMESTTSATSPPSTTTSTAAGATPPTISTTPSTTTWAERPDTENIIGINGENDLAELKQKSGWRS